MLKMFSTQLSGLFKRLQDHEEFAIEDAARLMAQAAVGEGAIYVYGNKEMGAVPLEAVHGAEPLHRAIALDAEKIEQVTIADRVLLVTREANDPDAVSIGQKLVTMGVPFVAVSTVQADEDGLESLADVHIDLKLTKGILPGETGERFGIPTSIAALFVYYGMKFAIEEMLVEYE
ncbi:DUF2529 domain-containing protein [Bacillus sp. B15-48]|uniref:DUF2529 domain-containing protein n=1 Tax=Bacillus sp. B15-48 TaxID=1548601 RepID=UPI00193F1DEE|nr:DUF2529 domain-containing protein [Bacillus sp. B15-48]MBM4761560.1 DUF2529 family protein [Bacillus sp. B15-48]